MDELIRYLRALVLLQLHQGADGTGALKPEALLALAGFTHREIGAMLGKNPAAVAQAVSRARRAGKSSGAIG
jgi:hypothetical protein